ncbi:MAG: hypothetical protein JWQ95_659 [Sphaerisporangium sp.]|jgi:hypothetical protein|nr:hypothetical protein [Sphaerisporangium sp.]
MFNDALPMTRADVSPAGFTINLPTVLLVTGAIVLAGLWMYRRAKRRDRRG